MLLVLLGGYCGVWYRFLLGGLRLLRLGLCWCELRVFCNLGLLLPFWGWITFDVYFVYLGKPAGLGLESL